MAFVVRALALLAALGGGAGCKADKCRGAEPALELEVLLAAGVDHTRVKVLTVSIDAAGIRREQDVKITNELDDGWTNIAVSVGEAGAGGFVTTVRVEARDASGGSLARCEGSYQASGDACNFFTIVLSPLASDGPLLTEVQPPDIQTKPCTGMLPKYVDYKALIAVCEDKSPVTQCAAASRCNQAAGWNLCTMLQYKTRIGSKIPDVAWIAGCVAISGKAIKPVDSACGTCLPPGGGDFPFDVAWDCSGVKTDSTTELFVGLVSGINCRRVGVNDAWTAGMWSPTASGATLLRAFCCN